MIINILRNVDWINLLVGHNNEIRDVCSKYVFKANDYDVTKREASDWFDPDNYRSVPLSRTYPNIDELVNHKEEYKLIMYLPNYVTLFLIKELYNDRKDILIEDCGAGSGNLIHFLHHLCFTNFHIIDKFYQCPKSLFTDLMEKDNIKYKLNDLSLHPTVVNNCSSPFRFITYGLDKNRTYLSEITHGEMDIDRDLTGLELICFYANREWERIAPDYLEPQGFSFLCKDKDDMGLAWCRNDKWDEFTEKLEKWRA